MSRKKDREQWDFIGIDGEGSTKPNELEPGGKSIYQLLTAYHPSFENSMRSIEQKDGLATTDCLEFLLNLRFRQKKLAICGYGFTYDICNILIDLNWKQLKTLAKDEAAYLYISKGYRYKIRVIYKKLLEVWKLHWNGYKWKSIQYVRVYDVIGFFQKGFAAAVEEWKVADKGERAFIEKYKSKRGEDLLPDFENWKRYNLLECKLLRDLMLRFNEMLTSEDIHLTSWWGAGCIASYWYRQSNIKQHLTQDFGAEINRDILYAYFGGQVQTFYRGRVEGPVYHYDINSAYPWATSLLPSLRGKWEDIFELQRGYPWAIYEVEYDFRGVWEETRYGPLPWRLKHQQIVYPRRGRGIFWAPELLACEAAWPGCIKVRRGRTYIPEENTLPFAWVPPLFERRNRFKQEGDPRNIPLKLGLNSLYGKTAQGEGMKDSQGKRTLPAYQSYMWAGLITALTRAKMIEAIATNPAAILNVSTDGLFSRSPLPLKMGKGLGEWSEEEQLDSFELYGNGVYRGYYRHSDGSLRTLRRARGYEERNLDFDLIGAEFRSRGTSASVQVSRLRFRGYKIAAHRNNQDQFATWAIESTRFTVLSFGPYKAIDIGDPNCVRVECTARSSDRIGMFGPDNSFPEPYIPRGSPLPIAENFDNENWERKILDIEQP